MRLPCSINLVAISPPNSFSFRYACYETFGWTPEDIKKLVEVEVWRLAICLNEIAKYAYKVQMDAECAGRRSPGDNDAWDIDVVESED